MDPRGQANRMPRSTRSGICGSRGCMTRFRGRTRPDKWWTFHRNRSTITVSGICSHVHASTTR
eukprot:4608038-Amphidinium_carterae.3